jgi:hypothetical protein
MVDLDEYYRSCEYEALSASNVDAVARQSFSIRPVGKCTELNTRLVVRS